MKRKELEAVVISAGDRGVKIDDCCQALEIDYPELINLVYSVNQSDAPYKIHVIGKKLFAVIDEQFNQVLEKAGLLNRQQLTKPLLETLTIAAYLEPCAKSYIDYIRGVDSWQSITALQEHGYVEIDRKQPKEADPVVRLTDKALSTLGISQCSELTDYEQIRGEFMSKLQNIGQ